MANEYMVNASDVLSIANAIREKGGTTEGLAFPDDFVTSIQNLSGVPLEPPVFDYTGTYNFIDEGDGNWKIKFLTNGTLTIQEDMTVDVFCVGGGASGSVYWYGNGATYYGGGGGSGYTTTVKSLYVKAGTYDIVIGEGGIGYSAGNSRQSGRAGGATSAFGVTASGGYGSTGAEPAVQYGGHGGSGGAGTKSTAGGSGGLNGRDGNGPANNGEGQGTTTKEFEEPNGTLYATAGSSGVVDNMVKAAIPNTGNGGDGGVSNGKSGDGSSGIVVIRNVRTSSSSTPPPSSGLNFTVVNGLIQPNTPVENMIWLNTELDITSWTVSNKEPVDLLNGIVWFKLVESGSNIIDAVNPNDFLFAIQSAKQYQYGSWVDVEAQIYRSEAWENALSSYVVYDGEWHETLGFQTGNTSVTVIDNTSSPATIAFARSTASTAAAYFQVDVTDYTALEVDCEYTGYQWAYIGLSTDNVWYDAKTTNLVAYKYLAEGTTFARQVITFPVSELTGTYYFKVYGWAGGTHTFKLHNMHLV